MTPNNRVRRIFIFFSKFRKNLLLGVCVLLSLLAFQNCTNAPLNFGANKQASSESASESESTNSGNGGSYDGKPTPGTYYHLIPNYRCGGEAAIYASLVVDDHSAKLATLSSDDCRPVETELGLNELDYSGETKVLIGIRESIFEKREMKPDPEAQNEAIVEAWCKAKTPANGSSSLSIFVKTNSYLGSSMATLVQTNAKGASQTSTFSMSRSVSGPRVKFSAAASALEIDLANLSQAPTTFTGQFKGKVNNVDIDQAVECRTGNRLDQHSPVQPLTCPVGYLAIPLLAGKTSTDICVAKFEAKQNGAAGVSQPNGLPWVGIDRDASIRACRANGLGYDLIANEEWQTVARQLELVAINWSGGAVGSGALNTGHSDNNPSAPLAASNLDNASCVGTGQSCNLSTWHSQRRIHLTASGSAIWDFAGNVSEWVKGSHAIDYGYEISVSQIVDQSLLDLFGSSGSYSVASPDYGGLGSAVLTPIGGAIYRSGYYGTTLNNLRSGGIFSVGIDYSPSTRDSVLGFRCVYHP